MQPKNIYRDLDREDVMDAMYKACERVNAPKWVYELVTEALYDEEWDWFTDFDGCTLVQDPTHPYVPCFIHDWMWCTGRGGWKSHIIFQEVQKVFKMPTWQCYVRTIATGCYWYIFKKWKHYIKDNVNPPTKGIKEAYEIIRSKK